MTRFFLASLSLLLSSLLLLSAASLSNAQQSSLRISTVEEIKDEFSVVPCNNKERLTAVKALFEKMGAAASDISIEKSGDVENLVVRKTGASPEQIVIGAHYDKVSEGCGAVDNWTGIVALAHLYRTLKTLSLKKTVLFVAFGKEEKGLVGSRAMVKAIPKEQIQQYCSMINIDSLGLSAPHVADNLSSRKLTELAADVAKAMEMPFSHSAIEGADADSSSFNAKNIPALTIDGLSDEWPGILHSKNDQIGKVNHMSVYLGYRLSLSLVTRLDAASCSGYR